MNEVNYRNEESKASDSPPNVSTTKPRHVAHVWSRCAGVNAAHGLSVLDCRGQASLSRRCPRLTHSEHVPFNTPCHLSIPNICSDVLCKATRETIPNAI